VKQPRRTVFVTALIIVCAATYTAATADSAAPTSNAPAATPQPANATNDAPLHITFLDRYEFLSKQMSKAAITAEELSGIARIDDEHYYAIGDAHACLHHLTIRTDRVTGKILSAKTDRPLLFLNADGHPYDDSKDGKDREGIVYDRTSQSVWISNEQTEGDRRHSSIEQHRLSDGRLLNLIQWDTDPMLHVYESARRNRGWESLTRSDDGSVTWTGNEEAVEADGPTATSDHGTVIRLQKLDRAMHPVAQYAYVVDSYPSRIRGPLFLIGHELSGLSELLWLPGGRLLALERAFAGLDAGDAGLRTRIYLIDFDDATDVSKGDLAAGLVGRTYTPVQKTLLWEKSWGLSNSNFEGMALGPRLRDGGRVLFLIADNNGGTSQTLVALKLSGLSQ